MNVEKAAQQKIFLKTYKHKNEKQMANTKMY